MTPVVAELANLITSPEVLPWITGSGGALVVLSCWVSAERKDKQAVIAENKRLTKRVDDRDDTVAELVRECTACIVRVTETVASANKSSDDFRRAVEDLKATVANHPCYANSGTIPRGMPTSV